MKLGEYHHQGKNEFPIVIEDILLKRVLDAKL